MNRGTFSKAQISALAATAIDFGSLTVWVEVLKGFYPIGVGIGAAAGAMTNFFLNRHWSFQAAEGRLSHQMVKYAGVSVGSLLLNMAGVYLLTEWFGLFYLVSKILTAVAVGVFYNYPLHRYFVYSKGKVHV